MRIVLAIVAFIVLIVTTVTVVVIVAPYLIVGAVCAVLIRILIWGPPELYNNREPRSKPLPLKSSTESLPPPKA